MPGIFLKEKAAEKWGVSACKARQGALQPAYTFYQCSKKKKTCLMSKLVSLLWDCWYKQTNKGKENFYLNAFVKTESVVVFVLLC